MKPSEILQSLKDILGLNRSQMLHIYRLEEFPITQERVDSILKNHSKRDSAQATYEELGVFLDGLIIYKRGLQKETKSSDDIVLTNNLILKKIRAALNLKELEINLIFELADYKITKSGIKDLFRSSSSPKLKECTNNTLRAFLEGLNEFYFESNEYL